MAGEIKGKEPSAPGASEGRVEIEFNRTLSLFYQYFMIMMANIYGVLTQC